MKKAVPLLCTAAAVFSAAAAELPAGWSRNRWPGYQPYAAMETVEGPIAGQWAIHVSDIQSKHGFGVLSDAKAPATDGDRLRVTFLARGRGAASVGYVSWTAAGEWNQCGPGQSLPVTDDWRLYEAEFLVSDLGHPKKTAAAQLDFGGSQGGELWYSDIRLEVVRKDAAPGSLPEAYEFRDRRVAIHEDFERGVRGGQGMTTDIAPGLLEKTRIGVWRTEGELVLPYRAKATVPKAPDGALSAGARLYALRGTWTTTLAGGGRTLALSVRSEESVGVFDCALRDGAAALGSFRLPRLILPADVRLDVNAAGGWGVDVVSLSDSSVRRFRGKLANPLKETTLSAAWSVAAAAGHRGGVALDELDLSTATLAAKSATAPCKIDRLATFDPAKAGWPLVFADDFDGGEIDWSKWYYPHYAGQHRECVHTDGVGHLVVEARADADGKLVTDGIWTTTALRYGYFEARVKFTRKPGWWAAFWLYGTLNTNPFLDGFEIDVFEDYYMRSSNFLDHNVHVFLGSTLKSWNFRTDLTDDPDGWHVIGCRWTPFEISYYLDGKLMRAKAPHAAYDSVTFDALRHVAGLSPLHAIVSGQIGGSERPEGLADGVRHESYFVDWVRLYAYPQPAEEQPEIRWTRGASESAFAAPGSMLKFSVAAGAKRGRGVSCVYLFDNGFLVDWKTAAPFDFDVRFSEAAYARTAWCRPGRSGRTPAFDVRTHVFVAFVQDEAGNVASTEPVWRIPASLEAHPYGGEAQPVPGVVRALRFDDGGRGVSNYTKEGRNAHWTPARTNECVTAAKSGEVGILYAGDWLNYTVDVAEAGRYRVTAKVGTGIRQRLALKLFVDGLPVGRLPLDSFTEWKCGMRDDLGEATVALPAGRHVLTVGMEGGVTFSELTFEKL